MRYGCNSMGKFIVCLAPWTNSFVRVSMSQAGTDKLTLFHGTYQVEFYFLTCPYNNIAII